MKSYSQAVKILKKGKITIGDESIKSSEGLNRVCASNVHSNVNYPSANNSLPSCTLGPLRCAFFSKRAGSYDEIIE